MSCKNKCNLHTGDVGAKLGIQVTDCTTGLPRDLSAAVSVQIVFVSPSGVRTVVSAVWADFGTATGDGTDGQVMFVTPNGDFLNECGTWCQQAYVTEPSGAFSTTKTYFEVAVGAGLP